MSEELKPCPFCGGEAEIVDAEECGPQAYVVTCNGCMTSSRVIFALMDDVTFDLVSAWNTRADLLPVVKPLEWAQELKGRWVGAPPNKIGNLAFWVFQEADKFVRITKDGKEEYPTLEDAQAAAQADYEARIRACLDMTACNTCGETK